jgi:hypothetical protein
MFSQNYYKTCTVEKMMPKVVDTSVILKITAQNKQLTKDENSPNLVTV